MSKIDPKYRNGHYNGFETSYEILQVLESKYEGSLLDEESEARIMWQEAGEDDVKNIVATAWDLADDDEDELFWGVSSFQRD